MSAAELAQVDAPQLVTELPGPKARAHVERDERVTSPSLTRAYPLVPVRASGCVVEDIDGNLLLDFNAGIAVTSTGHSHPQVVEAIQRQAGELLHFAGTDFYLPAYAEVCERLTALFPGGRKARAFLTNSGTEAVEAAVKLARWHTGRQYVIAFFGAFHGRSYGSVSLTASKARQRARFGPLLPGVLHAPYADSFRPALGPETAWSFPTSQYLEGVLFERLVEPNEVAAIVVEPIQGEGGYVVPPPGWLAALRELCDRHGILLVCDEVQSGIGRTGRMWAVEREGVVPDILVAGKGIASGMPLGAMLAREEVATWTPGTHGSTYGGNPLACAAALATLDLVEGGLIDAAERMGDRLRTGLRALAERHPVIRDVRGAGLMIGVELTDHDTAAALEHACFRRGLLILSAGDAAVRISPPLVVGEAQVDRALELVEAALGDLG